MSVKVCVCSCTGEGYSNEDDEGIYHQIQVHCRVRDSRHLQEMVRKKKPASSLNTYNVVYMYMYIQPTAASFKAGHLVSCSRVCVVYWLYSEVVSLDFSSFFCSTTCIYMYISSCSQSPSDAVDGSSTDGSGGGGSGASDTGPKSATDKRLGLPSSGSSCKTQKSVHTCTWR